MTDTRKFRVWASLSLVGCTKERIIEVEVEDIPDDPQNDRDFNEYMEEELWNSGMLEWGFEEVAE